MSKNIHLRLVQKIEEFKSLELAKSHLDKLNLRIKDMQNKLGNLQATIEREYKDVEALEKLSLRSLFEKVLGDKESQLEKERQDYLHAVLSFNECKKSMELLDFERKILKKKLVNYNKTKSELHNLIRQRKNSLMKEDPLAKQLISDIDQKIDRIIASKRELHEAIIVGKKINKKLNNIISTLEQVRNWGQYTLNDPDQHIQKMTFINKAKEEAYLTKQLLQEFEDELTDIYSHPDLKIQASVETFKHFIYSFFDGLISDWVLLMSIKNALYTVHQVNNKVTRMVQSLQYDLKKHSTNLTKLEDKKEKIILELN